MDASPPTIETHSALRTMLPFYVPVITVTLILAVLFAVGVREQQSLREAHIERVLAALELMQRRVADDMRAHLMETERSLERYRDSLQRAFARIDEDDRIRWAAEFAELTESLPDGSIRSRREGFDGTLESGLWVPRGLDPDPDLRAMLARAKSLTDEFGLGAQERIFADTWWLPAPGGIVVFGPTPELVDFVFQAQADFSYADTDWMRLTRPENNPQGQLRWTPLAFDPTPKIWMFSAVLPLHIGDRWWGAVGHDVPLARLLRETASLRETDGSHFVLVTADDKVVASDRYAEAIVASGGQLTLHQLDDPTFATAVRELRAQAPLQKGSDHRWLGEREAAFVSHLGSQDWLLVQVVPHAPITGPIESSFKQLRDLTLLALLLELVIATGALAWNHLQARRSVETLAAMHRALAERERRLAELNGQLEHLVDQRTRELSAAKQRAEDTLHDLQGAQKQLIASEKLASLGQLVAGVSHEINTPIGIAVTAASHLQEASRATAAKLQAGQLTRSAFDDWLRECDEGLQLILGSLDRAHTLIGSFKQVAVDQSSDQRRRCQLDVVLGEAAASMQPFLRRSGHVLQIDCPPGIELDTYPGALFQIVSNCVNNSLLHGFADRKQGRIRLRGRRSGDMVEVVYEDDGCGMSAEVAERAFEPFFTTRRGHGGSGLGLHIVHNLVTQLLGGAIDLHSAPERGMQVTVRFPAVATGGARHTPRDPHGA